MGMCLMLIRIVKSSCMIQTCKRDKGMVCILYFAMKIFDICEDLNMDFCSLARYCMKCADRNRMNKTLIYI